MINTYMNICICDIKEEGNWGLCKWRRGRWLGCRDKGRGGAAYEQSQICMRENVQGNPFFCMPTNKDVEKNFPIECRVCESI